MFGGQATTSFSELKKKAVIIKRSLLNLFFVSTGFELMFMIRTEEISSNITRKASGVLGYI